MKKNRYEQVRRIRQHAYHRDLGEVSRVNAELGRLRPTSMGRLVNEPSQAAGWLMEIAQHTEHAYRYEKKLRERLTEIREECQKKHRALRQAEELCRAAAARRRVIENRRAEQGLEDWYRSKERRKR